MSFYCYYISIVPIHEKFKVIEKGSELWVINLNQGKPGEKN